MSMSSQPISPSGELENKVAILNRLMHISTELNSTLQLDDLLGRIMDAAAEITGAESASVLLWNQNTRQLFFAASTSDAPADLLGKPVPLESSIAGTILQERKTVIVNDVESEPRHYTKIGDDAGLEIRSLIGVPMTVKNRPIGVLEAINKHTLPWTKDDEQYLTALASQAAVAIESAQLISRLKRANEELSQVDKLKSDFIAIASHELRTPLGVILGYASFLQEENTSNPKTQAHATKVMNSALHLRKIIEAMTNLRYLQQNATDLNKMPIAVADLLQDVYFDVMTLLDSKSLKLQIAAVDGTINVEVDRAKMAMALTNILNNAIGFTPEGERIIIEAQPRASEVWIRIKDHGIGIEPDKLERIFEQFYQVENHMTRHHQGLGIGLSIARGLIEAHGGRVWAESGGLGHGTTFTIVLPMTAEKAVQ